MKKKLGKNSIILFIISCFIVGCYRSNNKDKIQTLRVYENIDKKKSSFSLDQIVNDKEIISLETTENSLISDVNVKFVTPQYICLLDRNMLVFFDHSGRYRFKLNAKGDGPSEYSSISNVFYNPNDSTIYIHDMFKNKILEYGLNGQFIADFKIENIGSITNLDNEHYAICYSPYAKKDKLVGILDQFFQVENEFISTNFNNETYTKKGYILINDFLYTNRGLCIKPLFLDTVYQIYTNKIVPYFIIDKDKLNIPIDILSDISQQKNFSKYITNDYGFLINNLYFMSFYYNNKFYQDIWNIDKGELLYRNIASSVNDKYGVPIHINNEIIHVWPIFVNEYLVYCKIDEQDQLPLKSSMEDNDILLKFTFSSN